MSDQNLDAILEEASLHFARGQNAEISGEDRARITAWRLADPRHAVAYAQVEHAWERAEALRGQRAPRGARGRTLARRWGAAAAVAAAMAAGLVFWLVPTTQTYRTEVGERRIVALPDGSRADMNTGTVLRVAYGNVRRVTLDRGEAHFHVAKDAQRPFIVAAGDASVRAVGTAFLVRRDGAAVLITVTEGIVALAVAEQGAKVNAPTQMLSAGAAAKIANGAISRAPLPAAALRQRLAWRDGAIELQGETLGEAAGEFNRYNERKLIVADAKVASLRVGGRFLANEPDKFVRALEAGFPVRSAPAPKGDIYLLSVR